MRHFTEEAIQIVELGECTTLAAAKIVLMNTALLPNDLIFELGKLLSPKELRKSSRLRFMKDRRAFIAGRGMLRKLASEIIGLSPEDFDINEGDYGKPYLAGFEKLLPFNLSNSGEIVVLALDFSCRELGIDVEKINLSFDYWDVAGHYFSDKECSFIHSHRDFYRFWTMKEALLKVTGVGLVDELQKMDISGKQNRVRVFDERLLPFKNKAFTLYTFENEELVITLAVAGAQLAEPGNEAPSVVNVYFY